MKKRVVIDGQEVEVTVCPPSRRRAASSIQKPKHRRVTKGAAHVAKERGLIDDQT